MKQLYAFFENLRVGILSKDDDGVYSFTYDKAWRNYPDAFPISLSMPLEHERFGNKLTLAYFENLLPEGEVRKNLEAAHKVSGVFELLAAFGRDCAGGIILAAQPDYTVPSAPAKFVPIKLPDVYEAIEDHRSVAEVISENAPGYLSIAGAQDKFPAIYQDGNLFLPTNGHPTTHIVKVPIWRMGVKESVYNEQYCMELARAVSLNVPRCEVIDGRHPLFIIERYDRQLNKDGSVRRIHQQDFCQALGYTSDEKYEAKHGPSFKQCYDLLLQHVPAIQRLGSIERLLDWLCFNMIIGNNDSHSKNLSLLLLPGNKYHPAPLYDLVATSIYPKLDRRFAFNIGGRDEFSKIGSNQIELFEKQLGIKSGAFKRRLQGMIERITKVHQTLANNFHQRFPQSKIANRIADLIDDRINSLRFQKAVG